MAKSTLLLVGFELKRVDGSFCPVGKTARDTSTERQPQR